MDNIKVSMSILLPGTKEDQPAKQVINMSEEAYTYMVAIKPEKFKGEKSWGEMTQNQRIKYHAIMIAKTLGGELESFEVLK